MSVDLTLEGSCHNACVTCEVTARMVMWLQDGDVAAGWGCWQVLPHLLLPPAPSNPTTATLGLFPAEDLKGNQEKKPRDVPTTAEGLRCCPSALSPSQSSSIPARSETLPAPALISMARRLEEAQHPRAVARWLLAKGALVFCRNTSGLVPPALGTAPAVQLAATKGGSVSCNQHRLKVNISD